MNFIRHKISVVLIGACLILGIVLLLVTNRITGARLDQSEYAKIEEMGATIASFVAASMDETDSSLRLLKSLVLDPNLTDAQRLTAMEMFVNAYRRFSDITVYAPDGSISQTTTQGPHPEPLENTRWFEVARDTQTVVTSNPHRVNGVPGLHVTVYMPVQVAGSEQPHVLKARLSFDCRIEAAELGENGEIVLLDSRGRILYDRDVRKLLSNFNDQLPPEFWVMHPKGDYVDASGTEYLYSATTIPSRQTIVRDQWTLVSFLRR